jgi:hypothetical protein
MPASFAPFAADFLEFTSEIVWCTATTVDAAGRPRSRILHPIFQVRDGLPAGWVMTSRTPVKTAHLAANPHVAISYWSPAQHTVTIDCVASWVDDPGAKRDVWDLFTSTPEPLGYNPDPMGTLGGAASPHFTPLRFDPWRVAILRFEGWDKGIAPRVWRAEEA